MVLLIEDNAVLAKCLRLLLSPAAVVVASSMGQAVDMIAKTGPQDTVLVDLGLPDSTASNTLCRIAEWKKRANAPRVVIITGISDPRVVKAAQDSSADAVAIKGREGFFRTLKNLSLIDAPKGQCADAHIVGAIEREVSGLTGTAYGDSAELRTLRALAAVH